MVHPDYLARSDREFDNAVSISFGLLGVRDRQTALLVASFVSAMLQTAQGDDKETEMLYHILSEMAHYHPETIGITYVFLSSIYLHLSNDYGSVGLIASRRSLEMRS